MTLEKIFHRIDLEAWEILPYAVGITLAPNWISNLLCILDVLDKLHRNSRLFRANLYDFSESPLRFIIQRKIKLLNTKVISL